MCSAVATRRHAKATLFSPIQYSSRICDTRVPIAEENWLYYETNKSVDSDREFDKAITRTFYKSEKERIYSISKVYERFLFYKKIYIFFVHVSIKVLLTSCYI